MVVTLLSMVYKMVRMTQDIAGFVVEAASPADHHLTYSAWEGLMAVQRVRW